MYTTADAAFKIPPAEPRGRPASPPPADAAPSDKFARFALAVYLSLGHVAAEVATPAGRAAWAGWLDGVAPAAAAVPAEWLGLILVQAGLAAMTGFAAEVAEKLTEALQPPAK